MFAVISTVQAVATATPTPTPSLTPVATPIAHAVASNPSVLHQLGDIVNHIAASVSSADVLVIAALLAVGVQYLINRFKPLAKVTQWIVSFVLPFVIVSLGTFVQGSTNMKYGPVVYLLAQIAYAAIQKFKANVTAKATAPALPNF